jgi:hypothetical protein
MKTLLILILTSLPAFAELVKLTDAKGRSLDCEIISATETTVFIKNVDGKTFDLALAKLDEDSRKTIADFEAARLAAIEAAKPKGLVVESQAVKRITASRIGGDFRYFFYLRNHEPADWSGTVTIRLVALNGIKGTKGEFKVEVAAGGGASGHFDSKVGPVDFHGEYGVVGFEVVATNDAGEALEVPGGNISSKFEDLAK